MKNIICFSLLLTAATVNAQLTQANHAPVAGDKFETLQCDTAGPGAAGAGVSWDFSAINTHSSIVKNYTVIAVTNTAFPSASVATAPDQGDTTFYSSSASSLLNWGGKIDAGQVKGILYYSSPAIAASYPMNLNTTASQSVAGNVKITVPLSATGTFTGNSMFLADATGTLILPGTNNTHTNVLRRMSSQTIEIVSITNATVTQVNYDWYSSGTKYPIFSISTATASHPLGTSSQTIVTRMKPVTTPTLNTGFTETSMSQAKVEVFPNPAGHFLNFTHLPVASGIIVVTDCTGRTISGTAFSSDKTDLDVSRMPNGVYFYTVSDGSGLRLANGKFCVSH